ncbi:hypothetical protein GJAV_G00170720 [Gymnothorax javanicus]|nr:hypothetical protein GJAV_G00170720 [Gymnothorax javanicus]
MYIWIVSIELSAKDFRQCNRIAEMANRRRVPTLLLTFTLCFLLWPASGKVFFSHLGIKCAEDCKLHGSQYQCNVIMADGTEELHYCSPQMNVDYLGNECIDCCETHGYGYYWCAVGSSWGYCGEVIEDLRHYTSNYDVQCYDSCGKRGKDYYWCHSQKGWDYCSPSKNIDYKGYTCKKDSPCTKNGEDYYWCYLEEGSWGYCARVEPKAMIYQTYKLKDCIDECQYDESGSYYWCHTPDGWDYCSPLPDITYKDVPCRQDHKCGTHGYNYNWCYTADSYDYCGVIHPGECMYSLPRRSKRTPNNKPQVICTKEDNNNRRTTTFTAVEDHSAIAEPNNRLRTEALDLINRWDNQRLGDQARSNLITSDHLRIDLQGLINRNNQRYYNLQIQENRQRSSRESTTLSQIIVPVDTSAEYMRLAFRESLQRRARVTLEVTNQPTSSSSSKKCVKRRP